MKQKSFIILMIVFVLILAAMAAAVWRIVFYTPPVSQEDTGFLSDEIEEEEIQASDSGYISWEDSGIEVGKLTYTITRAGVLTNLENSGQGNMRESAVLGIYGDSGEPTIYYYPDCFDETGTLVEGGSMVILDIRVDSEDAVNFITNPATGVQSRRYEDNPFLFRADEIAYLVDTSEDADSGYTYYDAVFFTNLDDFTEHPMAYELLPGESITFRIGYLLGNLPNGKDRDYSTLVVSTGWNDPEEEYFELNLN